MSWATTSKIINAIITSFLKLLYNLFPGYKSQPKKIACKTKNKAEVRLSIPEDGISPGQACVFYKKDELGYKVLGGGWIKS